MLGQVKTAWASISEKPAPPPGREHVKRAPVHGDTTASKPRSGATNAPGNARSNSGAGTETVRPYDKLSAGLELRREQCRKAGPSNLTLNEQGHAYLGYGGRVGGRGRLAIAGGGALAIALAVLIAGFVFRDEIAQRLHTDAAVASADLIRAQSERDAIARELDTAWGALKAQSVALGDHAVLNQELVDTRETLQRAEALTETYRTMLQQERARNASLEEQLNERAPAQPVGVEEAAVKAALADRAALASASAEKAALGKDLAEVRERLRQKEEQLVAVEMALEEERNRARDVAKSPMPDRPLVEEGPVASVQEGPVASVEEGPVASVQEKPVPSAPEGQVVRQEIAIQPDSTLLDPGAKSAGTDAILLTSPEGAPATLTEPAANPDLPRFLTRALVLRENGDIAGARAMLERAGEMGSADALFALAETYDPARLLAWRTVGTRGDIATARTLYTKALAGGAIQAADRLNALR